MTVQYLEIVTPDVEAVCATYSASFGVVFGEPDPRLGHARTAEMAGGGMMGVRAPMHEAEEPIVRPYWLTEDIAAAFAAAVEAGAEAAHPPLEISGVGTFAIIIQGGVHHGFWQK